MAMRLGSNATLRWMPEMIWYSSVLMEPWIMASSACGNSLEKNCTGVSSPRWLIMAPGQMVW